VPAGSLLYAEGRGASVGDWLDRLPAAHLERPAGALAAVFASILGGDLGAAIHRYERLEAAETDDEHLRTNILVCRVALDQCNGVQPRTSTAPGGRSPPTLPLPVCRRAS
jgi:hypothetical protein